MRPRISEDRTYLLTASTFDALKGLDTMTPVFAAMAEEVAIPGVLDVEVVQRATCIALGPRVLSETMVANVHHDASKLTHSRGSPWAVESSQRCACTS